MRRVVDISEFDGWDEMSTEVLDVVNLGDEGGKKAGPTRLKLGLVAPDEIALDSGKARR